MFLRVLQLDGRQINHTHRGFAVENQLQREAEIELNK